MAKRSTCVGFHFFPCLELSGINTKRSLTAIESQVNHRTRLPALGTCISSDFSKPRSDGLGGFPCAPFPAGPPPTAQRPTGTLRQIPRSPPHRKWAHPEFLLRFHASGSLGCTAHLFRIIMKVNIVLLYPYPIHQLWLFSCWHIFLNAR